MIELNEYALEKAREATYFGGLEAAIVAYLEALPKNPRDGSEQTRKASNDGTCAPPAMPCVPNSGFDSRDGGQLLKLFEDHYWDSLEQHKEILLFHIRSILTLTEPKK